MSLAINAQTLAAKRYTEGQLRSKKRVLGFIADAWDVLHEGTCGHGKGASRLEPIERLSAKDLATSFFGYAGRDEQGRKLYWVDATQVIRL